MLLFEIVYFFFVMNTIFKKVLDMASASILCDKWPRIL